MGARALVWSGEDPNSGSANYRLRFPARCLIDEGADVVLHTEFHGPKIRWDRMWTGKWPPPEARVLGLAEAPEADTVVIHRPGRRWWADIIPHIQKHGIRVVVDIDDLLDQIHKDNAANFEFDPRYRSDMNFNWIVEACRLADVVTCTTEKLKQAYGHGHGIVLPNLVPEAYLSLEAFKYRRTVGWTGTVPTHPTDLQVTNGDVARVIKENDWRFHHVGFGDVQSALRLEDPGTVESFVPFDQYPEAMAHIDVGIVPLADTPFNEAKSCLKMIEFAALGVPVVATGTPDNLRMHKTGVGVVVKKPHDWYRRLNKVVSDEAYREDLAQSSRNAMSAHTYEQQCWRWAEAWGLK